MIIFSKKFPDVEATFEDMIVFVAVLTPFASIEKVFDVVEIV